MQRIIVLGILLGLSFAEIRPVRNLKAFDNSFQKNPITNQWQNKSKKLLLEWQEPFSSSDITSYYYYFGLDKNGSPTTTTSKLSLLTDKLDKGTYFFRIYAQNAEKEKSEIRVLEVNYDPTPPENTLRVTSLTESSIVFDYKDKANGAKVDGINVYWGQDPDGLPDQHISGNVYYILKKIIPNKKYYIRACLEDQATNICAIKTITENIFSGEVDSSKPQMAIISREVSANAEELIPGSELTYKINLRNHGTGPAHTVEISDVIPDNTTLVLGSAQSSKKAVVQYWDKDLNGGLGAWANHAEPNRITKIRWIFQEDYAPAGEDLADGFIMYSIKLNEGGV